MVARFADRLLAWFDANRRDLPWRRTGDPWAIWVSEIMLQQTRVETVRRIYDAFLERYPTPESFASIADDELLGAWKGLGYYRRARLLRDGARAVRDEHGGVVPADPKALRALPGIGEYTQGAIASIAFGHALPAIDGNVERVFARHRAIEANVRTSPGKRAVRDAAVEEQCSSRPGDFNQALMELGATACSPLNPSCEACPVATDCAARAGDRVATLPVLPSRPPTLEVLARAVLVERRGGKVLGYRIPAGQINAGQVDLPGPGPLSLCPEPQQLQGTIFEYFGATMDVGEALPPVRHGITNHRITMIAHRATLSGRVPKELLAARPDDPGIPWTTLARKVFARAGIAVSG